MKRRFGLVGERIARVNVRVKNDRRSASFSSLLVPFLRTRLIRPTAAGEGYVPAQMRCKFSSSSSKSSFISSKARKTERREASLLIVKSYISNTQLLKNNFTFLYL